MPEKNIEAVATKCFRSRERETCYWATTTTKKLSARVPFIERAESPFIRQKQPHQSNSRRPHSVSVIVSACSVADGTTGRVAKIKIVKSGQSLCRSPQLPTHHHSRLVQSFAESLLVDGTELLRCQLDYHSAVHLRIVLSARVSVCATIREIKSNC